MYAFPDVPLSKMVGGRANKVLEEVKKTSDCLGALRSCDEDQLPNHPWHGQFKTVAEFHQRAPPRSDMVEIFRCLINMTSGNLTAQQLANAQKFLEISPCSSIVKMRDFTIGFMTYSSFVDICKGFRNMYTTMRGTGAATSASSAPDMLSAYEVNNIATAVADLVWSGLVVHYTRTATTTVLQHNAGTDNDRAMFTETVTTAKRQKLALSDDDIRAHALSVLRPLVSDGLVLKGRL